MFLKLAIFVLIVTVNAAPQNFIINGEAATTRAFSYAVIVHSQIVSGGHIITNRHILTAGHVIQDSNFWIVGVGNNHFSNLSMILASGGVVHPNYRSAPRENDIGILILSQALVFNENVQPIALSEQAPSLPLTNEQGHIFGFGLTSDSSAFNSVLYLTFKRVIDSTLCNLHYRINPELQFCAEDSINLSNICVGDLGGGFLTWKRGAPLLVGIASMTVDLCSSSYPAAFTRVSPYRTWITEVAHI